MQIHKNSVLAKLQERISGWTKMKRIMALILVVKDMLLKRIDRALLWQQLSWIIGFEMIQKDQVPTFKIVQAESFNKEIKHLMPKKGMVPSYSTITQLDPFLDSNNLIHVGGWIRKFRLTKAEKHPIILPRKTAVSDIII